MRITRVFVVGTIWAASLLGVGLWAQGAAGQTPPQVPKITPTGGPLGPVITGENIGFQRIVSTADSGGKITGRWMVKVNGEWRETVAPAAVVR